MESNELKETYLSFFEKYGHKRVENSSLIPENDPSVLFTTAGMHPLVPFLMGEPHPLGKRVANVQRCIRTGDIDEVGDETHFTFFEMLGNWSLGDYFKDEAIRMSFEFLTEVLKIPIERLAISCFEGDSDAPKDTFSAGLWEELGIPKERIAFLPKEENWWGPAGKTGPCGPDTEMFVWNGEGPAPNAFDPEDDNWVEIWNDVFMEYDKQEDGTFVPLKAKNVDTGMGLERVLMIMQGKKSIYEIDTMLPIQNMIRDICGLEHDEELDKNQVFSIRVICDHMRAATFILGDERGVTPSNIDQGYILRRFIRRTLRHFRLLGVDIYNENVTTRIAEKVIEIFKADYPLLETKREHIVKELKKEEEQFKRTLEKGLKRFEKMSGDSISGEDAFLLFQSFGFPIEMIEELAAERGQKVDVENFQERYKEHQELSRTGAEKKFRGGLAVHTDKTTKLHTATHLLNEALREVLDQDIAQRGSNITDQRLRFDFNFPRKLTKEELKQVEGIVNAKIKADLPVTREKMKLQDALDSGVKAEFEARYPPEVWVYSIGDFSREICNGPHVERTGDMGTFRIKKEESSSAGVRRIKAVLD